MKYLQQIRSAHNDPRALEELHQSARRENQLAEFASDLLACYQETPDNVLYAAWYYRLQPVPQSAVARARGINWKLAISFSLVAGVAIWWLTDSRFMEVAYRMPQVMYAWAPIEAGLAIAYLTLTTGKDRVRALFVTIGLAAVYAYVHWFTRRPIDSHNSMAEQYAILMALHVPLAAWIAVGLSLVGFKREDAQRFAFLSKSIEVFITGGIFAMGIGVFAAITLGLFAALNVRVSDAIMRLLIAGGCGAIPVLAVAAVYDPGLRPAEQKFEQGLGKLISMLMRLLLPLTVLVLAIYLAFIPFNFMAPFRSRELLIVYNAMLFAIMGLLIGAIPVRVDDMPAGQQKALRLGILVLAALTVVVSAYALSAIVYRTVQGMLTPNRVTVIGWNAINIVLLILLVHKQFKHGASRWIESLHAAFSIACVAYTAWAMVVIVALPLLFP